MTSFSIEIKDATDETLADELERIAAMIREGFTCGEVAGTGWWTTAEIKPSPDADPEDDDSEPHCSNPGGQRGGY